MRDRLKELSKCRKAWEKLVREWKENKGWTLATKFNDLRIIIKKMCTISVSKYRLISNAIDSPGSHGDKIYGTEYLIVERWKPAKMVKSGAVIVSQIELKEFEDS